MKIKALVLVCVVCASMLASAAGTCAGATVLMADGRVTDFDFVAQSTSNFYQAGTVAGRSYTVEVRQNYDDVNTDLTVTLFSDGACGTTLSVANNNATEPVMPANGSRFSFIATTSTLKIQVSNANATTGRYISVVVSDTTLFNPRWSSAASFHTEWGLVNTTGTAISATFTLLNVNGTVNTTTPVNIPAKGVAFLDTRNVSAGIALNIPDGQFGYATLAHNGPPGALVGDAYIINAGFFSGPFIQPGKFEATRQATH